MMGRALRALLALIVSGSFSLSFGMLPLAALEESTPLPLRVASYAVLVLAASFTLMVTLMVWERKL